MTKKAKPLDYLLREPMADMTILNQFSFIELNEYNDESVKESIDP